MESTGSQDPKEGSVGSEAGKIPAEALVLYQNESLVSVTIKHMGIRGGSVLRYPNA